MSSGHVGEREGADEIESQLRQEGVAVLAEGERLSQNRLVDVGSLAEEFRNALVVLLRGDEVLLLSVRGRGRAHDGEVDPVLLLEPRVEEERELVEDLLAVASAENR